MLACAGQSAVCFACVLRVNSCVTTMIHHGRSVHVVEDYMHFRPEGFRALCGCNEYGAPLGHDGRPAHTHTHDEQ